MRLIAPLLLLAACVHTISHDSADRQALDAVEEAWELAGLPDPGACLERVEVRRHDTRASYVDVCEGLSPWLGGREAAQHSAGCLTDSLQGVLGRDVAVINLAPGYHDDMGLVQHEAIHRLVFCALKRTAADPWDATHSDPRVWAAAGGATSVQSRARP